MQEVMYEAELEELGLTANEAKVYLALLKHGMLNPTKLAEKTGMHRSYIYDTLERLSDKGIVNLVHKDNKRQYQPVDPKVLRQLFELKLRKLDEVLPKLSGLFQSTGQETKIELHKGKRVYRTLIKELTATLKKGDMVYLLGIDETALETVEPIYLKQYFTIIREKGVQERIIIPKGGKRLSEKNVVYRELDPKYLGEITLVIHQNRVFLFVLGDPYHLIIMTGDKIAKAYLRQFTLFWDMAAP